MTPLSEKIMAPDENTEDPNDYLYDYVYIVQMSDALWQEEKIYYSLW